MTQREDAQRGDPMPGSACTYPVTIHLPAGARWPRVGDWAEVFVSVARHEAEAAVIAAALNWSNYLRSYCKMELGPIETSHAVRGDQPVILGRAQLREATREGSPE